MTNIDFKPDTVGHFISDKYLRVPIYQRSFSWDISNVEDLFEDIKESYPDEYFVGTIVVTDKRDYFEIVDGQQRLATINIFFAAVRDFLKEINNEKSKYIENQYIQKSSLRDEDEKQKLKLNNTDNDFYLKRIIKNETNIEPSKDSHNRLLKAYEYAKHFIKNKYESDGLNGIFDFIEHLDRKLKIITVVVSDDINAFTIFETLNDRGLVLSQTDLIKNYLLNKSDDRLGEAQEKWARFTAAIEAAENEEEILQYIRYFWSSKNGLIREKELFKDIKNKIRNKNQTIAFLTNLEKNTDTYLSLLTQNHPLWKDYPSGCSTFISELRELRLIQNRPLLLAILENFSDKEEVRKALKIILSQSVRNLITGVIGAGTLETEFSKQAKIINDGTIRNSTQLKNSIQDLIPTDEQFKNSFKIAAISKAYIARYYLRKLEESYRTTNELSPLPNPEKVNLEHILPENPENLREDWPSFDENTHKTYSRRIGNMTLIDTKMNSNIGNGNFSSKKEIYKQSEIEITKRLSHSDEWTPDKIEERQKEFSEKAVEVWGI